MNLIVVHNWRIQQGSRLQKKRIHRLSKGWLRGTFQVGFSAESADGFLSKVRANGQWRRRSLHQHNPESAAIGYVMESVRHLAINHSVLAADSLAQQASAYLGNGANIQGLGTRVVWAQVYVDVDAEIQSEAYTLMRLRAREKKELEDKELRIAQAVAFHDLLQKDPSLAIAHLLLEAPERFETKTLMETINTIGEQLSIYTPGGTWVKTAQLLEKSFGKLPEDKKQAVVDRICKAMTEFGMKQEAEHIHETYKWQ